MFAIHHMDSSRVPPFEYLPSSAMTPHKGLAMVLSAGKLVAATGAAKPQYICPAEMDAVAADTVIPAIPVGEDMVFETTASAALTSAVVGTKLTIHTDGMQVTATTGGCALLVAKDGDVALVRFVDADPEE